MPSGYAEFPSGRLFLWKRYNYIIYALVMHDIKSRFFGSGLGQVVMILWPIIHVAALLAISTLSGRPHPYGDSLLQYSVVSVYPFICFNYASRWICYSAFQNKGFLNYPIIHPLDILIARTFLEVMSIFFVLGFLIVLLVVCGDQPMPADPFEAVSAVLGVTFLSVGFGFLNAPFAMLTQFWLVVVSLIIISCYASSGILFVPTQVPEPFQSYLSYNPLLVCIEWLRSAYFPDYPTALVYKEYVIRFALASMTCGLILLRLLRRYY